jgi:hypothetical protein
MQFAAASFMRTLIILSIVVLLKIEQQLARGLVKRAVPRRHSNRRNAAGPTSD